VVSYLKRSCVSSQKLSTGKILDQFPKLRQCNSKKQSTVYFPQWISIFVLFARQDSSYFILSPNHDPQIPSINKINKAFQFIDQIGVEITNPIRNSSLSTQGDRFVLHDTAVLRLLEFRGCRAVSLKRILHNRG
jgi:hypothetical protein